VRERRVTTDDGVSLAVLEVGRGPALLCVHGFGGAKEDFADHLEALGRAHRVIVFDQRGHGASDKPDRPEAYSKRRLVADTLAVADALGAERFRLLGHSMGGMVARRLVLDHPARVDALVLMDTAPGPVPGLDGALIELAAQVALTEGMDRLRAALEAHAPLGSAAHERLVATRPGYQEFLDRKWAALSPVMWATLVRAIRDQDDELEAMAAIRIPTLVVVGEQDTPFLEGSRAMAARIPGACLAVIPDAGHSPQFENPEAWRAVVEGFLNRLPDPGALSR
jgi:pimeloyl-ACP methyl ester carboxylesterase